MLSLAPQPKPSFLANQHPGGMELQRATWADVILSGAVGICLGCGALFLAAWLWMEAFGL